MHIVCLATYAKSMVTKATKTCKVPAYNLDHVIFETVNLYVLIEEDVEIILIISIFVLLKLLLLR